MCMSSGPTIATSSLKGLGLVRDGRRSWVHPPGAVVRTYERVTGRKARVYNIPERILRAIRRLVGPVLPVVPRILDAGLFTETGQQKIDMHDTLARYPIPLTPLEEFVRHRYCGKAHAHDGTQANKRSSATANCH